MKKFYSFLFAAVALVGFAACNSDSTEDQPTPAGVEKVSFKANIEETKTGLDAENKTTWVDGDNVTVTNVEEGSFVFTYKDETKTFDCEAEGVKGLLGKEVTAAYNEGKLDSTAGVAGAILKTTEAVVLMENAVLNFAVESAFLKFTTTGTITLKGAGLFSTGDELTVNAGEHYVAINPTKNEVLFSCESYGAKMKETNISFDKQKIYNLGELTPFNLFIQDNSGYMKMCVYAWDDKDNRILGDWPGSEATTLKTPVEKDGKTYTKVVALSDKVKAGDTYKFILNNGGMGSQYAEFVPGALSGDLHYTAKPKNLVYIRKNGKVNTWASNGDVYCYMWDTKNNNQNNHSWPGAKVDESKTYKIYNNDEEYFLYDAGEDKTYNMFIINNNNEQTGNLTIKTVGKTNCVEVKDDGSTYVW